MLLVLYFVYSSILPFTQHAHMLCLVNFAVCSPSCRNGGTCRLTSSTASCVCPSRYSGSYCQNRGITTHSHATVGPRIIHMYVYMIVSYLQTVVQLVRMEELVILHLSSISVTVLVIIQDPTASRKVHMCTLWTAYAADGP